MSKLRISPDLSLPDDVVTSTTIVYGGKGMGKTNFGSVLIEELTKAGLRWCLLDPMGVAWGLRHSKDGKGPGVECVILGGAHGDIPIEPTAGAIVADLVVDENANVIIDFSRKANGKMWTAGERIRFVTDYTVRLFERQGELVGGRRREPLIQILDEAARYIPQTIPSGAVDVAKCVGAWEQVCEEGRNIGLGVAFLTQRSARMNKSVSELADVMFAFRTVGPRSLAAIMDWLGEHVEKERIRDIAAKVRELNIGQALVVSPGWLRVEKIAQIRERETFDSSATPKPGQAAKRVTGDAAKPNLATYEQRMAATIEKARADDPRELRKEIAALKKQLAAPDFTVDQRAIDRAVASAVRLERARFDKLAKRLESQFDTTFIGLEKIHVAAKVTRDLLAELMEERKTAEDSRADVQVGHHEQGTGANRPSASTVGQQSRSTPRPAVAASTVGRTPQRMINAMLFFETVGVPQPTRAQVGGFVGVSSSSGSFRNYLSELRTAGYIADLGTERVELTEAGRAAASDADLPRSLEALHATWRAKFGSTPARMFDVLVGAHPDAISRDQLGAAVGVDSSSGSFRNYLSELRSPGALIDESRTHVRAADMLFPEGLR